MQFIKNIINKALVNLPRVLLFLLTFSIIIISFLIICFYFFRGDIKNYIIKKALQHHIVMHDTELNLNGSLNVKNITSNLTNGAHLTIAQAVIRPPLDILPGYISAYNIDISGADYSIKIPSLKALGLVKKIKNSNAQNKLLEKIAKYNARKIIIPELILNYRKNDHIAKLIINQIEIKDFYNGNIGRILLDKLYAETNYHNELHFLLKDEQPQNLQYICNFYNGDFTDIKLANLAKLLYPNKMEFSNDDNKIYSQARLNNFTTKLSNNDQTPLYLIIKSLSCDNLSVTPFSDNELYSLKNLEDLPQYLTNIINIAKHINQINLNLKDFYLHSKKADIRLNQFQLSPSNWKMLLPYNLLLNLNGVNIIRLGEEQDGIPKETVKFNTKINFKFHPDQALLDICDLDLSYKKLFDLHISTLLGGIDKEIFDIKPEKFAELYNNILLQKLNLSYQDNQSIDNIIDAISQKFQLERQDIKNLLYTLLEKTPAFFLKNNRLAKDISNKLLDIAQNPQCFSFDLCTYPNEKLKIKDLIENSEQDFWRINQKFSCQSQTRRL